MPTDENKEAKPQTTQNEIRELGFLLDIPLEVSVEIGSTRMPIKDLLQLQEGSIIELDKLAGEPLDLYVNSRLIARGEAVMVKDRYGLRLTDVVSPAERLENLG